MVRPSAGCEGKVVWERPPRNTHYRQWHSIDRDTYLDVHEERLRLYEDLGRSNSCKMELRLANLETLAKFPNGIHDIEAFLGDLNEIEKSLENEPNPILRELRNNRVVILYELALQFLYGFDGSISKEFGEIRAVAGEVETDVGHLQHHLVGVRMRMDDIKSEKQCHSGSDASESEALPMFFAMPHLEVPSLGTIEEQLDRGSFFVEHDGGLETKASIEDDSSVGSCMYLFCPIRQFCHLIKRLLT